MELERVEASMTNASLIDDHNTEQVALEAVPTAAVVTHKRRSLGIAFWVAVGWLSVVVGSALTAAWIPIPDPNEIDIPNQFMRPGAPGHVLGTDDLGRDMLSRV